MVFKYKQLHVKSNGKRVTFSNITEEVQKFVQESGVKNGLCLVSSPHTTCSVICDEFTHDKDWNGDELLQVDLVKILDKIIPREQTESDYLYPGEKHVAFLKELNKQDPSYDADPATILNADAHIRASIFGSSEENIIKDGQLLMGTVSYLYFVDWDQNRVRDRKCNIAIIGE